MARIEQRYQGSFTLHAKTGMSGELVRKIQRIIYNWLVSSERKLYGRAGCYLDKDFYESCKITSMKHGASNVTTNVYYSDCEAAWCMKYVHDDSAHKGIDWVTECGLRLNKEVDEVVVAVMLTTMTTGEHVLNAKNEVCWQVSVPRFVKMMLWLSEIESVSVSGIKLPLAASLPDARRKEKFIRPWMNWVKTEKEAQNVLDIIENPRRRFAVILVVGETLQAKSEVRDIATNLCGKTYVCLVDADWRVMQHFKKYEIYFNHLRLILPFHTRKPDKLSRHPVYALLPDDRHKEERERVLESQAGYVTSFEEGAVYRQEDVVALNRLAELKRRNMAFKQAVNAQAVSAKDAKEMLEYAESVQKDFEAQKKRAEMLEKDRDEWRTLVSETEDECRRKLRDQKVQYEGMLRRRSEVFQMPRDLPVDVTGLREWASAFSNLEIVDSAWKGMEDRNKPDKIALAWNMLWHLNETMHKIHFLEEGAELRKAFKECSGYDYAADENEDVKKKWPDGHRAIVNGETFWCWRHIKRGNNDKHLVRIYFEFDERCNRIVVSWIGQHLRTNLSLGQ